MEPITLEELATAIDGVLPTPAVRGVVFERITLDAGDVSPGEIFWMIAEERGEAQEQISIAESRGAVAVVASRLAASPGPGRILVPDARAALARFARWYRSLLDAYVVGIAGSYDSRTARSLTRAALGIASEESVEDCEGDETICLPLTLLHQGASTRFAIIGLESGQGGLAAIARPEAAIVTRLDGTCRQTTDELLESLPRGGFAVLPGDQCSASSIARRTLATAVFVGEESGNTHRVRAEDALPGRVRFRVDRSRFEIAAPGRQFSIPAGMAVVAARRLGRRDVEIAKDLEAFKPDSGRGRVAISRPWAIIDETAEGHPDSLAPAMAALAEWPTRGRRIFVCGDLAEKQIELGGQAFDGIDRLVTIGNFARQVAHEAREAGMEAHCLAGFSRREEACGWLRTVLRPGDVVWVKGARSAGLDRLVIDLVRHADAASVVLVAA